MPDLDLPHRPSILFVCTANICRSPMAEGVFKRLLARRGIKAHIDSAATHDYFLGMPPYPMAVEVAKRRGYDITHLKAMRVIREDFRLFDLVVAMDEENRALLRHMSPRQAHKVHLLLDFDSERTGMGVPDPYGGWASDFEFALSRVEKGCRGLARAVLKSHARSREEPRGHLATATLN